MTGKKLYTHFFWPVSFIIFIVAAFSIILLVSGFRLNLRNFSLHKTGIIYLESMPEKVTVHLDNKLIAQKTPHSISYLLPGRYIVKLSAPNRQSWEKTLVVESGKVTFAHAIILWNDKITPTEVTNYNWDNAKTSELLIVQNELYDGKMLVTRLSQPIVSAVKAQDTPYYYFATEDAIWAFQNEGLGMTKLVETKSAPTKLDLVNREKDIVWIDASGITRQANLY